MKISGLVLAVSLASAIATSAQAQNYPWCAYYKGAGGTNCGFVSYAQCMATVSGITGFCAQNTQYQPPPGPHASYEARKHHSD